ncbi:hypothetical protein KP509_08G036300 [Ceratopteris richardii]|nr:hypothetical protein KP509_08G036300 [Ceratopteris richardii]
MIKMHKRLVRLFFENSVKLLQHDGEVHVSHKATAPYTKWKLEKQAAKGGLTVKVICDFQQGEYPGYINRRGDGNDSASSFHLGPCKTFIFKKHPGIFSPWNQLSNMLSAPLSILGLKHRAFSMPVQERFASCINGVQRICHKRRRDDENDCISALCQATDGVHALKRRSLGVLHTMNRTALPPTTSMVLNIPPRGRNKMSFTSGSFSPLVDPRRAVMSLRNSLLPGMSMVRQRHPLPFLL